MISNFFKKLKLVVKDKSLSSKMLFVLGGLLVFRLLAAIPIPGVDHNALNQLFNNSQLLGLINLSSGGGLSGFSIVMLGVGPYITASIIMQVMSFISPKLKAMTQEEGEAGRKKFSQYSRTLSIPLAMIQGLSFLFILQQQGVLPQLTTLGLITNVIIITAGSMLVMWIGELITEFGIGNGTSLIIFAGIVAGLPSALQNTIFSYDPSQLPSIIGFVLVAIVIITGVVFVTEAERPVPITYSREARGGSSSNISTYLPLRLNQAGVIPIIFALSILLIPNIIAGLVGNLNNITAQNISDALNAFVGNQIYYGITYFILVFLFTYFYTAVTFDPENTAKNLQKGGAFVPGVRPGEQTAVHIGNILSRTTFVGATFLGLIAVLPIIVQSFTGIATLTIGGTGLLIAVSVAMDLVRKIDSQISVREY